MLFWFVSVACMFGWFVGCSLSACDFLEFYLGALYCEYGFSGFPWVFGRRVCLVWFAGGFLILLFG